MSTDATDPFVDLLAPGEVVIATMAGGGPPKPNGARVWIQLALTDVGAGPAGQRLLAVVLVQAPHGGAWQPVARYAAYSAQLELSRYPRTPISAARLEVHGLPQPLVVLDIDDPNIFPHVEPFLVAWAGPAVTGGGVVHQRPDEAPIQSSGPDPKLLLAITGGILALSVACCACSGVLAALQGM